MLLNKELIKYQDNEEVLNNIFKNLTTVLIQKIIEVFFIAKLKESNVNMECKLLRCYANGHTYGNDANIHYDDVRDNTITYIERGKAGVKKK